MARLLGIDYGEKRIGLALSDPMGIIASPHDVLQRTTLEEDLDRLAALVADEQVEGFVIGRPRNADGSEGPMVERVEEFAAALTARVDLTVHWVDESYTSIEAESLLREQYKDWRDRKARIDMVAAQIILRTYLASP